MFGGGARMVDLLAAGGRLLAALFLVALNGFFVGSEFALVRVRSTAVDQMVEEGRAGAKTLQAAVNSLDDYLAATQLGITVASLGLGWIGEPAVAALIEPLLGQFLSPGTVHLVAIGIGFSAVTFLHVVFGELAPKTIAIARAEKMALFVAPPMKFFYYLFYPGLVVFNGTANAFTSLLGVPPASETEETLSEEEIRMVLSRSGQKGHVGLEEVEMIEQVFELDDIVARDVMVPQPDVITIQQDTPLSELRGRVVEYGHTRYPVVETQDDDEIIGYIDVKDVLHATESSPDATAGELARDLLMVPETTRVDALLQEFQSEQSQMAAVIDEWGSMEGIVTVEDAVEVVVGDLRDTFDTPSAEPSVQIRTATKNGQTEYSADGALPIQQLNEELGTAFERSVYATVGGLVLDSLGEPPQSGDIVTVDGYEFEVDDIDGARIERVLIRPLEDAD